MSILLLPLNYVCHFYLQIIIPSEKTSDVVLLATIFAGGMAGIANWVIFCFLKIKIENIHVSINNDYKYE